ncbi:sodium/phosphate symporter [Halomicrococcus sp. NG-SE-24]|uniref:sodium/phosphate symporter n=1 Tax=Halomicrococcus sp. NG-SE-24 TaxID=3436928 RepID=UPI003D9871DD
MDLVNNRRSPVLVSITVYSVALAMRTIPLFWSPLPFNVDGLHFARTANETLSRHHAPMFWKFLKPDEYVFTMLLATISRLTGISPLYISQTFIACIGATLCLFVVIITWRVGVQLGWSNSDIRIAALLAGGVLATEGIFLGRSTAVSSEGLGHLFVLMSVFVFAYALITARPAWILITGLCFLLFPLTHNLSTIIGAFSSFSLLTLCYRDSSTRANLFVGVLIVGLWVYAGIYYTATEINQVSRIFSAPGLFIAWIIALMLLTVWLSTTQPRLQRSIPLMMLFGGGALVIVNYFVPIFPGTATGEQLTLLFLLPIIVIGIVAFWGYPYITQTPGVGYAIAALLVGTLSLVGFALTAGLTVKHQGLAVRGHIFIHIAVAVLAGLGSVGLTRARGSHTFRMMLGVGIIICSFASAPLAFSGLHATSAQPLITQSEFETGTFAAKHVDQWTSDGHMTRISLRYYPTKTNASEEGIYSWLHGNSSEPNCPIVSQHSWTTVGAQLFPASPEKISKKSYKNIYLKRNVVYSNSGNDPLVLSIPRGEDTTCRGNV